MDRGEEGRNEPNGEQHPPVGTRRPGASEGPTAARLFEEREPASAIPAELGDFRIMREIGRGGMGVVYEALQLSLRRRVALKVLPFAALLDSKQLLRFKNEAQAAASLHHTNIVPVYAVGCDRDVHYYAMQYIQGQTLAQAIRELRRRHGIVLPEPSYSTVALEGLDEIAPGGGRDEETAPGPPPADPSRAPGVPAAEVPPELSTKETDDSFGPLSTRGSFRSREYFRSVARLGVQVAEALEHAHALGITHRDIKPSNLLLDVHGKVWVTDFGLAQIEANAGLTLTGDVMGTVGYMSPEQAMGDPRALDHRTDIYSLGLTLYELLTLRPAFSRTDGRQALRRVIETEPRAPRQINPHAPRDLETIVLKAIAKEPNERYRSAQEMADDLRRFLDDEPIRASRPNVLSRLAKWRRRHSLFLNAAAVVLAAATLVLAIATVLIHRERAVAIEHMKRAQQSAVNERRLRAQADALRRQAEESDRRSRQLLYAADIRLAAQALREFDLRQYSELLARNLPQPGRSDIRGFEWHYLWRLGHTPHADLPGHREDAYCVRLSPDGRRIATAGRDGLVRLLDAPTGRELTAWRTGQERVTGIAFAPDGRSLAAAGADGTLRVWDAEQRRERLSIPAHPQDDYNYRVVFAGDGRLLASCGAGAVIRLWDAATGQPHGELRGHEADIYALAVSPDGRRLATGSRDGTVRLWSVETQSEQRSLAGHTHRLTSVAFSPNGKWIASGANDHRAIVWDAQTGARLVTFEHLDEVQSVSFSPDSRRLATGDHNGAVRLWSLDSLGSPRDGVDAPHATPARTWTAHSGRVHSLAFAPQGDELLSGGQDGRVRRWTALGETPQTRLETGPGNSPSELAFTPDSRFLWAASKEGLRRWEMAAANPATTRQDHPVLGKALAVSPQGTLLAAGDQSGAVRVWRLADHAEAAAWRLENSADVEGCVFSPDGAVLAVADWQNDALWLWEAQSGRRLARLPAEQCHDAVFSRDSRWIAVDSLDDILVWRRAARRRERTLSGHISTINDLALSPDGRLLASGSNDRQVKIWDFAGGVQTFSLSGHRDYVQAVAFSPDGLSLVSGDRSGVLRVWRVATGSPLCELEQAPGGIRNLAFSPDGRFLAAAAEGQGVLLLQTAAIPSGPGGRAKEN